MRKGMSDERMEKRLQRQIEGLYGNEALTSHLDDSSAKEFLKWAEDRVRQIVQSTAEMDDETAEEAMYPRLKAIRRMARYINQIASGQGGKPDLIEKIFEQSRLIYGEAFSEPDRVKLKGLLSERQAPSDFIQSLKHFLEGDIDAEEEDKQHPQTDSDPFSDRSRGGDPGRFRDH